VVESVEQVEDMIAMAGVIHDVIRDVCLQAEDDEPGRVVCFEAAQALAAAGYGRVGRGDDQPAR